MIRVALIGAGGRMGKALVRAALERKDLTVSAAVVAEGSEKLGRDLGELAGAGKFGIEIGSDLSAALAACDVAIDFSNALATAAVLAACTAAGKPLLLGTTGHAANMRQEFERAARHIALLVAANTSLGVTVLLELVRQCARQLPVQFDVEIIESHHRAKLDAPSGTALALGQAVAESRGQDLDEVAVHARVAASGPRREGEIGFAVVRGGDVVGEHQVVFAGLGEQLTLAHRATDRAIFARGALDAAAWLARRPPGRYAMRDILF
ncbi:MAG TPA: 4-hydroxy-tetrahydrodipicolinate reductase [Steroidobacteraceae bacterium]|nr:4-hydroxy-tetrahydrodipicolinate reductase [Steroidobacteraceae bacterium]